MKNFLSLSVIFQQRIVMKLLKLLRLLRLLKTQLQLLNKKFINRSKKRQMRWSKKSYLWSNNTQVSRSTIEESLMRSNYQKKSAISFYCKAGSKKLSANSINERTKVSSKSQSTRKPKVSLSFIKYSKKNFKDVFYLTELEWINFNLS